MLGRAGQAVDIDPKQAKAIIEQASRLLAPPSPETGGLACGLAPWQERKVARHIAENLAASISNRDLAGLVGLSVNHFARCFKGSFGVAPREYVIRSRLERAKVLMTQTRASLCQIALESGFCDQAHMCRTFHSVVGVTPRRWRRDHAMGLAA
jgi:AraC-like DNA-binding protein